MQKNQYIKFPIDAGEMVAFRSEGETFVGRVTRVEDDTDWIEQDGIERSVPRADVFGKVVSAM